MARGQDGFASPFLYDSFIHYFTPVYPDAIQANRLLHHFRIGVPSFRNLWIKMIQ